MFQDIPNHDTWLTIEKIDKGYSKDSKYFIKTKNNDKQLLRISDISEYSDKEKEFAIISKYSKLGFTMSRPIDFGRCNNNQQVYMLLTWVEGVDLEDVLPQLDVATQYKLGREAGHILKKIHNLDLPKDEMPTETKIPKKRKQLQSYMDSNVRIENDEAIIQYVNQNLHKMWLQPPVYQHGDFHPGNLIYTPEGGIGVIDLERWEIGDPYEEFYKLESFANELSIPYCQGQIDAYFDDAVPDEFWETLAVYAAHSSLYSIKWAEPFGQEEVNGMTIRCKKTLKHYNHFNNVIPSWYAEMATK